MAKHVYPTILKSEDWQKKKGAIAKMAKETGVGDAMATLQTNYEKVNWRIFDPYLALPTDREAQTKEGLMMVIKNAQAEYDLRIKGSVAPALKELKKKVAKAKTDFEKSKVIPKKAGEHCGKVLEAIDTMEQEVDKNTLIEELKKGVQQKLKDFATAEQMYANLKEMLKKYILALGKDMKTVKTKAEFMDPCWNENIRGLGTALPKLAKQYGLEEEHKQWRRFASAAFHPKTDEDVPSRFEEMRPVLRSIATKIA